MDFTLYQESGSPLVAPINCVIIIALNVTIHV
jgi:hypothetical protein